MRFSTSFIAAALPFFVFAVPVVKRQADKTSTIPDVNILQFASILEQLESNFYQTGLQKFQDADFQSAGFTSEVRSLIQGISTTEDAHVTFLATAIPTLNGQVPACQVNVDSLLTDVPTFLQSAMLLEWVGANAYAGAVPLVANPDLLEAAAGIHHLESAHANALQIINQQSFVPNPFGGFLDLQTVVALASPLVSGCDFGVQPRSGLAIGNGLIIATGTTLQLTSDAFQDGGCDGCFCQFHVFGEANMVAVPFAQCAVPQNAQGFTPLYITQDSTPIPASFTGLSQATIFAGAAVFFAQTQPEPIAALLVQGAGSSVSTAEPATSSDGSVVVPPSSSFDPASISSSSFDPSSIFSSGSFGDFDPSALLNPEIISSDINEFSETTVVTLVEESINSYLSFLGFNQLDWSHISLGFNPSFSSSDIITPGEASAIVSSGSSNVVPTDILSDGSSSLPTDILSDGSSSLPTDVLSDGSIPSPTVDVGTDGLPVPTDGSSVTFNQDAPGSVNAAAAPPAVPVDVSAIAPAPTVTSAAAVIDPEAAAPVADSSADSGATVLGWD